MAQQSITLLVKCIGNVVDCDNSIDRYRTLRTDNPKVASSIVGVPGTDALIADHSHCRRQCTGLTFSWLLQVRLRC